MSMMSENEQKEKPDLFYLVCKGKYENDANGERRHICMGHVFTTETKLLNCPVCGNQLIMLQTKFQKPEAITLAMEKCFKCQYRKGSTALNYSHCVGRETRNQDCDRCSCKECCNELVEDFTFAMRYGLNKTMAAINEINVFANWALQQTGSSAEVNQLANELKANRPLLRDIPENTYLRWICEAYDRVKNEAKRLPKNSNDNRLRPEAVEISWENKKTA